ncbi:precorrin-6y C5,15-methyltransferase (decarboxylating) subunit CbiE [Allohahella sp. A8]|uniref:precorrin-6y C5,15-methyltransferase (decarboxylating) subunit CbiE n=1 Tax=Allohahella sp. A8 TaxID=3141461 RepID=UPI003A7FAAB9
MKNQQTSPAYAETTSEEGWLTLVGLSEAGWAGLAEDARAAVLGAEVLFGGARHLAYVPEVDGQVRKAWPSPIQPGLEELMTYAGRPVCVLASGDPFWFGIGATLSRYLPAGAMRSLPGPSAFSLAAARMGWPLQDCHCFSVVARDIDRLRAVLSPGRRLLVLSEDGNSPARVARLLVSAGYGDSQMVALQSMGGASETRCERTASAWGDTAVHKLNTLAIECRSRLAGHGCSRVPGRDENEFTHDGQISKREIRAVILAYLAPRGGEHLWDLGAGSGAVSIEWLLADAANTATAVEVKEKRVAQIMANAQSFGVGHLQCIAGRTPAALSGLVKPDAIFIGGGITEAKLLDLCWQALSAGGRCVASAVTAEGEAALIAARARYGGALVRLAVERSEALGRFTGWRPLRTITLWHARVARPKQADFYSGNPI